ncbi:MAG TPA: folylpolyglutamate synthase/dihydrofolate synthase family protein, partial [bacterium]|nr:folylpolyglutamate synthase/dihydrofolate synthase family protein [bacterium]
QTPPFGAGQSRRHRFPHPAPEGLMSRLDTFLVSAGQEYRQMRLGLERIRAALDLVGHPERSFASVLIAGTNGKGSTSRMVESVLRRAGHRTGLYTSPHLLRFSERILLSGQEASEELLESILEEWAGRGFLDGEGRWPAAGEELTWFEKATLLAFEVFRRAQVEIAVLEVGLGGRLDATNVVDPLVSAVTSIGMDHAEILGSTLAEIAKEKAGVLRRDRVTVLGPLASDLLALYRRWAEEAGAQLIEAKLAAGGAERFSYGPYRDLSLGLEGRHQLANAAVAIEILSVLEKQGFPSEEKALREGLGTVQNPGRLQWLPGKPPLLLDGAHNPPAFHSLADYLQGLERKENVFVLAMMKEKDPAAAVDILGPLADAFVFTELDSSRSLPLQAWQELAEKRRLHAVFFAKPRAALEAARDLAGPEGRVIVTGSLFLVAEILANRVCHSNTSGAIAARLRFP